MELYPKTLSSDFDFQWLLIHFDITDVMRERFYEISRFKNP